MKACLAALLTWMILVPVSVWAAPNTDIEEELTKELEKVGKGLVDNISKIVEARVAELENKLKARDAEIAALKKQLAGEAKPKAASLSDAFLGVTHKPQDDGALIESIVPESPAAKSGVLKGDVLVALGDRKVAGADLGALVGAFKVGDTVKVSLRRGNESKVIDVTLIDREAFFKEREKAPPAREKGLIGVLVGEELGVGLWVEKVEEGLTGAAAGLAVGDLLRKINGRELKVLEDLEEVLASAYQGDTLTLDITRKDVEITKVVELGGETAAGRLIEEKSAEPVKPAVVKAPEALPATFGVDVEEGEGEVYVIKVTPDSTAAAYGFAALDVLRKINGTDIKTLDELTAVLGSRKAGDLIDLVVVRGGQEITVNAVKLAGAGEKVAAVSSALTEAAKAALPKPSYLGIIAEETGEGKVVITELRGEPATSGGLQKGDVIIKFQGGDVKTIEDIEKALAATHAGDEVTIVVMRGDAEQIIKLELGARVTE